MSTRISPNHREALTAVSSISGQDEYLFSTNHALNVNASVSISGVATSANQTNGQQLTQIVDAGGDAVTVTGGKLDVNASFLPSGTQDVNIANVAGAAISQGHGTAATAIRVELPTDGTGLVGLNAGTNNIGDVDVLTVPADPFGANADAASATGSISAKLRFIASTGIPITGTVTVGPHAVTNAGTFAVQATLAAETTKVIGTVNQGTSPWVTSNATTSVVGNGAAATAQRVTLANDSTGIIATVGAVTAITNALPAGTNAIGKLAANSGVDIGDIDVTSVIAGTGATNLGKAEDAAHTTGDTGVFALGVRNDTLADVTNATADYSQLSTDLKGRVMTAGAPRALKGTAQVQLSNTTTETTIISATASTFHDVYGIILANTGASTTKVSIRDDTAGTVRAIIEVPTLETRGFMLPVDSAVPQTAVNKNWTAQCGTATTALEVTAFYVSMV